MRWRDHAACHDEDVEVFFAHENDHEGIAAAVAICDTCPVRADCLTAALDEERGAGYSHRYGVRGGQTALERWQANRARECVICGTMFEPKGAAITCSPECSRIRHNNIKAASNARQASRAGQMRHSISNPNDPRHGTLAGYSAHRRAKDKICDACREANNAYKLEYADVLRERVSA